ncbi:WD40 repeat-like protein [Ceratobasidium sp. AG-I]|nr:WD40 repeat-like protein [Ceratobasidium sp. AG-I]
MSSQGPPEEGSVRLHIKAIDIKFKPPSKYPVNLKVVADGQALFGLPPIDPDQPLHWENIKPLDVKLTSSVELRVYEVHSFGLSHKRVGSVSLTTGDALADTIVRESVNPARLTATLTMFNASQKKTAARDAHAKAVAVAKDFTSVLNNMGKARDAVEAILNIGGVIASLHPMASLAFSLATQAWEKLKEQEECDNNVASLATGLGDMLPVIEATTSVAKLAMLKDTIGDMLKLVEDASLFIIEYQSNGAAVRVARAFVSSTAQGQVDEFLSQLSDLKEKFDRGMVTQVVQHVDVLLGDADRALLTNLVASGANYDHHPGCLAGTRDKILADIVNWTKQTGNQDSLLWLYGLAGSGKSAIAVSVCERLQRAGTLAGSFFCKRDDEHLRKPEAIISTIAARLGRKYQPYGVELIAALRNNPDLADSALMLRFKGLMVEPLQALEGSIPSSPLVVIVDALDENGTRESRRNLVSCLLQLSRLVPWLKVILTSRPNDEIREILSDENMPQVHERDLAQEDESSVTSDISALIRELLKAIPAKKMGRTHWPDEEVVGELALRAAGLFIWAQTACKFISSGLDPKSRLKQILADEHSSDAAAQLGRLYTTALDESIDGAEDNAMIVRQCVGAIVLTGDRKPLDDVSLGIMLQDHPGLDVLRTVIDNLGSVLYRDKDRTIRVVHKSFSDFMADEKHCPERYRIIPGQQNGNFAASCLQIMVKELCFNMCGLENSCVLNADVSNLHARVKNDIPAHLAYSCVYWTSHVITSPRIILDATHPEQSIITRLMDELFTTPALLYWIEALSLLGQLRTAVSGLEDLLHWINNEASNYSSYAGDVYRFISVFYLPISSSTPHIYVSALPFGAVNFETIKRLKTFFPNTISIIRGDGLMQASCLRVIWQPFSIASAALSSDGKLIVSSSYDHTVSVWEAETGQPLMAPLRGHAGIVYSAAFSPDSRLIVSGSADKSIRIWDLEKGLELISPLRGHSAQVSSVSFSPDGLRIVSGSDDATVRIWSVATGKMLLKPLKGHSGRVHFVLVSPNGQFIISCSHDLIRIWDMESGTPVRDPFRDSSTSAMCIAISSECRRIAFGSDQVVCMQDFQTGTVIWQVDRYTYWTTSLAISPDARYVALGRGDGLVCILNGETGAEVREPLQGHQNAVLSVSFTPKSRRVLSGSSDGTIRIWDIRTKQLRLASQGHSDFVNSVAFSPNGRYLASGSYDHTICVWDVETGLAVGDPLRGHSGAVNCVLFSLDSQHIFSGSSDFTVRRWELKTGVEVKEPFLGHSETVTCLAISPDDSLVASGSYDETVLVRDAKTGNKTFELRHVESGVANAVAFSPNGRHIAASFYFHVVCLWDTKTGAEVLQIVLGDSNAAASIVFSIDSRYILAGCNDGTIQILDSETGAIAKESLQAHSTSVTSIAMSPNGRRIASGSYDFTIRVWDYETRTLISGPLQGHSDVVHSIAFSPDNQRIASCANEQIIRLWDTETGLTPVLPSQDYSEEHYTEPDDGEEKAHDENVEEAVGESLEDESGGEAEAEGDIEGAEDENVEDDIEGDVGEDGKETDGNLGEAPEGDEEGDEEGDVEEEPGEDGVVEGLLAGQVAPGHDPKPTSLLDGEISFISSFELYRSISADGWVLGTDDRLMFWIPKEYQRSRIDRSILVVPSTTLDRPVSFDCSKFKKGKEWALVLGK